MGMITLNLKPLRDTRCPSCGRAYVFLDDDPYHGWDGESVVCGACGETTDYYEAWKAWVSEEHAEERCG